MSDSIKAIIDYSESLPNALKFLFFAGCSFLEYVFPIFPGDSVILFGGFLSAKGSILVIETFLASLLGSLAGSTLVFYLGRLLGRKQISWPWFKKDEQEEKLKKFTIWYQKWGYWLLFFNRFMPGIRSFFFIAAGMSNLPISKVLLCGWLSTLLFNSFLFLIGYILG